MRKVFIGIGLLVSVLGSTYVYTQARSYARTQYDSSCDCTKPVRYVDGKQRYVSRGCCSDAKRRTRPFSDRIGTYRYRQPSQTQVDRYGLDISHPSRRHDVWYHKQYTKVPTNVTTAQRKELQNRYYGQAGQHARAENTVASNRHVIRYGNYRYKKDALANGAYGINQQNDYGNYRKTGLPFSVDLQGLNVAQTDENTFSDRNSSLSFRIYRGTECSNSNFQQCAISFTRGFKKSQNLSVVNNLYGRYEYNTTVEHDGNKYPVYVEGFRADGYGSQNIYFIYSIFDPSNNSVVRIESVALAQDMSRASQTIYDVVQTFLFKPEQQRPVFFENN